MFFFWMVMRRAVSGGPLIITPRKIQGFYLRDTRKLAVRSPARHCLLGASMSRQEFL